jgi:hypothetical protein
VAASALRPPVDDPSVTVLVRQYRGMSRQDAYHFQFGKDEAPDGLQHYVLDDALPPAGILRDWWRLDHDGDEFLHAASVCRGQILKDRAESIAREIKAAETDLALKRRELQGLANIAAGSGWFTVSSAVNEVLAP